MLCAFSLRRSCLESILLAASYWLINGFDFVVVIIGLRFVSLAGQAMLFFFFFFRLLYVFAGKLALLVRVFVVFISLLVFIVTVKPLLGLPLDAY